MDRLVPFQLRAWALPLVVLALILPAAAAFSLVGPQLGLAVGALTVAALIGFAATTRFDEPIDVARASDSRYRLLLLAPVALERPEAVAGVEAILEEGARARHEAKAGDPQVLVLAPARSSALERWASDLGSARSEAAGILAVSLATLATAGVDALGKVGDSDPVQALEDQLHSFAADEVAILPGPGAGQAQIEEIRRRLDRPVRVLGEQDSPRIPGAPRAAD